MADSVDRVFDKAITIIQALSSRLNYNSLPRPPLESRTALYGLYKQATEGDVEGIIARPSGFTPADENAKKKWDAWKKQEGLGVTAAKRKYIANLIDTMQVYATGTHEARELLSELENLWDQIKDVPDIENDNHHLPRLSSPVILNNNNNKNNNKNNNAKEGGTISPLDFINDPSIGESGNLMAGYNALLYQEISRGSSSNFQPQQSSKFNHPQDNNNRTANRSDVASSQNGYTNALLQELYDKTNNTTNEMYLMKKEIKWAIESLHQEIKFLKLSTHSGTASRHEDISLINPEANNSNNNKNNNDNGDDQDQDPHDQKSHNDIHSVITSAYRYPLSRAGTTNVVQLPYINKSYLKHNNQTTSFNDINDRYTATRNLGSIDYLMYDEPPPPPEHPMKQGLITVHRWYITIFQWLKTSKMSIGLWYRLRELVKKLLINAAILLVLYRVLGKKVTVWKNDNGEITIKWK